MMAVLGWQYLDLKVFVVNICLDAGFRCMNTMKLKLYTIEVNELRFATKVHILYISLK